MDALALCTPSLEDYLSKSSARSPWINLEPLTMPLCTSISSRPQSQPVCSLSSEPLFTWLPWPGIISLPWWVLSFSARCHFPTEIFYTHLTCVFRPHTLATHHIISYSGISFAAIVNVTTISHCLFVGFVLFSPPQTRVSQLTVNIWSWIRLCHGDCPHHYRMVSSSPWPPLTRCQYHAHSCTNHKLVYKRPKNNLVENHDSKLQGILCLAGSQLCNLPCI